MDAHWKPIFGGKLRANLMVTNFGQNAVDLVPASPDCYLTTSSNGGAPYFQDFTLCCHCKTDEMQMPEIILKSHLPSSPSIWGEPVEGVLGTLNVCAHTESFPSNKKKKSFCVGRALNCLQCECQLIQERSRDTFFTVISFSCHDQYCSVGVIYQNICPQSLWVFSVRHHSYWTTVKSNS